MPVNAGMYRPPEMHERCRALRMRYRDPLTGLRRQCRNFIYDKDRGLCFYHLQHRLRLSRGNRHNIDKLENSERRPRLPVAYSKHLSESLASRLAELAKKPISDQLDMSEDLALARLTALDAAKLYDIATLSATQAKTPEETLRGLNGQIAAGQVLRDVISEVGDIASKAADMFSKQREFLGVASIPALVKQCVEIMYDELGDEGSEAVTRIAERIDQIRLPSERGGTLITPDMEVSAMDETVPRISYEEETHKSNGEAA